MEGICGLEAYDAVAGKFISAVLVVVWTVVEDIVVEIEYGGLIVRGVSLVIVSVGGTGFGVVEVVSTRMSGGVRSSEGIT